MTNRPIDVFRRACKKKGNRDVVFREISDLLDTHIDSVASPEQINLNSEGIFDIRGYQLLTFLDIAIIEIADAIMRNKVIQSILTRKPNLINGQSNVAGLTPIMIAVCMHRTAWIAPNVVAPTPDIFYANRNYTSTVKLLREYNPDLDLTSAAGKTVLEIAGPKFHQQLGLMPPSFFDKARSRLNSPNIKAGLIGLAIGFALVAVAAAVIAATGGLGAIPIVIVVSVAAGTPLSGFAVGMGGMAAFSAIFDDEKPPQGGAKLKSPPSPRNGTTVEARQVLGVTRAPLVQPKISNGYFADGMAAGFYSDSSTTSPHLVPAAKPPELETELNKDRQPS